MHDLLHRAAALLLRAEHVVCSTGAGISQESGIPTFRDAGEGLWAEFDPEELATPEGFRRNPTLVWNWYQSRREAIRRTSPNAGHRALVEIERLVPRFSLITQNIDNLHRRAGSRRVVELHGNIERYKCFARDHPASRLPEGDERPPRCPECGSYLRPDVVWFGEMLPPEAIERAFREARECGVMLVVGTSGLVQPAASLPYEAKDSGAAVIEVNPEPTGITRIADVYLGGPAGEILPRLAQEMQAAGASR